MRTTSKRITNGIRRGLKSSGSVGTKPIEISSWEFQQLTVRLTHTSHVLTAINVTLYSEQVKYLGSSLKQSGTDIIVHVYTAERKYKPIAPRHVLEALTTWYHYLVMKANTLPGTSPSAAWSVMLKKLLKGLTNLSFEKIFNVTGTHSDLLTIEYGDLKL